MRKAPLWRFSHVGLFVKDLDRMAEYYKQVFSMVETDGGEARGHSVKFLSRNPTEHHQLVLETSRTSEDTTLQQLSFRFSTLDDLRQMKARIEALPRNLLSGEMVPYGVNHGIAWSLMALQLGACCMLCLQQRLSLGSLLWSVWQQLLPETHAA